MTPDSLYCLIFTILCGDKRLTGSQLVLPLSLGLITLTQRYQRFAEFDLVGWISMPISSLVLERFKKKKTTTIISGKAEKMPKRTFLTTTV